MKPAPVTLPAEMAGLLWTTKDLARYMALHPRQVKRWWKRFKVKPDACQGNGCHRWTAKAVRRLLTKWRDHWAARGEQPAEATSKFAGLAKQCREKRQLRLPLKF